MDTRIGCWADGTHGHQYTRERCADALQELVVETAEGYSEILAALLGEMSDDAEEEYAACDLLEAYAPVAGASWGWRDGDFGLWPIEEEG